MPEYGLTDTGFFPKTAEIVRDEMNEDGRGNWGQTFKTHDSSAAGRLFGLIAYQLALLWELAEVVYNSLDPDGATGTALDALCALTGTVREAALPTSTIETLTGDPNTSVPAGSLIRVTGTEDDFETAATVVITLVASWVASNPYAVGVRCTNSSRVYECITAGTSAGSGGPASTSDDITDGTVHWRYVGEGTAAVDVEVNATETGPIPALSGTITDIQTAVSGWDSAKNLEDADLGNDLETDAELRVRRVYELSNAGTATLNAVRAAVLAVDDVTVCTVFANRTDHTDADGVPPHGIEVLVIGGDDDEIAQAIFDTMSAACATYSSSGDSAVVEDSAGNDHTIYFSRPTEVPIYVAIEFNVDADLYPEDGDTQVAAAIALAFDTQAVGKDGVSDTAIAAAMSVAGVTEITSLDMADTDPPSGSTKIAINSRQITTCDSSDVDVTSTPATP